MTGKGHDLLIDPQLIITAWHKLVRIVFRLTVHGQYYATWWASTIGIKAVVPTIHSSSTWRHLFKVHIQSTGRRVAFTIHILSSEPRFIGGTQLKQLEELHAVQHSNVIFILIAHDRYWQLGAIFLPPCRLTQHASAHVQLRQTT